MLFKRKNPRSTLKIVKEALWPSIGWLRSAKYMRRRVERIQDSSRNIALGLAFGASISFTPLVGTHIIQGMVLSYIFRANPIAAAIGTFVGNPWTFPFMWLASMAIGEFIFSLFGMPVSTTLPDQVTLGLLWESFKADPWRFVLPWITGGYILMLITAPIFYMVFVSLIRSARAAARKAKSIRIEKIQLARDKRNKDKAAGGKS